MVRMWLTTTSLTPNVKGFKGATPLEVYIKNNKVVKVEALPNRESPKFFDRVKQVLLPKFNGMKVAKAAKHRRLMVLLVQLFITCCERKCGSCCGLL